MQRAHVPASTRRFEGTSGVQTNRVLVFWAVESTREASSGFSDSLLLMFSRRQSAGEVAPVRTHYREQAKYSWSAEKAFLPLVARMDNRSLWGSWSSSSTLDGTWSGVFGAPPQYTHP